MILFLIGFNSDRLLAQPSLTCPDYSFCLEVDPLNCNEISVSINGVQGVSIAGLTFVIEIDTDLDVDEQATINSFENSIPGNHFTGAPHYGDVYFGTNQGKYYLIVDYEITNSINGPPLVPQVECLHIGNIVFDPMELDCIDFDNFDIIFNPLTAIGGPLYVGDDVQTGVECTQYTLDCPCAEDCPDNWGICFLEDGLTEGKVNVFLTGLEGQELAGFLIIITLDPQIRIIEQPTENSFYSSNIGNHNWDSGPNIQFFGNNEIRISGIQNLGGQPFEVLQIFEYLFDIYFEQELGHCIEFSEEIIQFGINSHILVGDNVQDALECYDFEFTCQDFEICYGVKVAGTIETPQSAESCDEGINAGFPYGNVNIKNISGGNSYDENLVTSIEGKFETYVYPNQTYLIEPSESIDHDLMCGVNSLDADRIQSHLLGTNCFDYNFQYIAADVKPDHVVNVLDIAEINRWILGTNTDPIIPWNFITSEGYNNYHPFGPPDCHSELPTFDSTIEIPISETDALFNGFIAVKMGDVKSSCNECMDSGSLKGPNSSNLIIRSDVDSDGDIHLKLGSGLENISVINMIFSDGLEVQPGTKLSNNNGNEFIEENTQGRYGYAFGWTNFSLEPLSVSDEEVLLTVRRAEFAKLEDFDIVFGEIVAGGKLYTVSLEFEFKDIEFTERETSNDFILISPNPSSGNVNLQINDLEFGKYIIKVVDMVGRQVLTQSLEVQTREVNRELPLGHLIPGVYAISIEGRNYFTSELLVINR